MEKQNIFFNSGYGPNFSEFGLNNNLFEKSSLNLQLKDSANEYFTLFTSDYEINGGKKEFQAEELEVFRIIYIYNFIKNI